MPSEHHSGDRGRKAVVYVGPPAVAGLGRTVDDLAREARSRAHASRLVPLSDTATTPAQAQALLAEHPDAVLVVHPGTERYGRLPAPGRALWALLCCGAVLRLCEGGSAKTPPSSVAHIGRDAFLVVELLGADAPAHGGTDRHARREAECRAHAVRHGLRDAYTLTESPRDWARGMFSCSSGVTAVVHPDVTEPDPDSPDGLLWRWLRDGREIRPGAWPLLPAAAADDARREDRRLGPPAMASPTDEPLPTAAAAPPPPDTPEPGSAPPWQDPAGMPPRAAMRPVAEAEWMAEEQAREAHLDSVQPWELRRSSQHARVRQGARDAPLRRSASGYGPPPFRRTGGPLPHDGLFIRRNNAFGTRSPLGVRDLIEQGVIIGQDEIRFDDFVAARTDQVPGPPPGRAVAVSHGLAAVRGEYKADEATTHFLEITLKAGEAHPEDIPAEPLPVNFVFVVDTSGSMYGEKLDCVKAALQALYDKLRPSDCLGIITFDHRVRTVLAATAKRDLPPERFAQVVSALSAEGGTDINLGVQYGIDEIGRNAVGGRTVNCLYLFSDGDPTSGERDWIRIRTNVAAKLRGDLTLSCFGFGSDARMPELAALAGLAGGHSTFVTRPEQVGADLLADLNRRDHLAAIDIQLRLDIAPDVEIRHLYGHDLVTDPRARAAVLREVGRAAEQARADYGAEPLPDLVTEEKGIRIFAPDLAFGETYWIVLELAVPSGGEAPEPGSATVQYVDTVTREGHRHEIDLSTGFTLAEETVTVHAVGLWTSEVTFHALDDLYERDRDSAKKRLTNHIQVLQGVHSRLPAKEFRDDQVTLRKLMTLADSLDTVVSFSDTSPGSRMATAVVAMNDFGKVRSGFWPRY
ncbi:MULTISPECIES: VWA domain-containing protein [unclassified Streptomyces]|uniref:VWA domain-containing protein n=1 Tax=unclassified Streptomyces TaxID=2593676 RepID=UPI002740C620|nr:MULTISPECIES: VWA domain-containing protein [unclassified Streptomyces]